MRDEEIDIESLFTIYIAKGVIKRESLTKLIHMLPFHTHTLSLSLTTSHKSDIGMRSGVGNGLALEVQ
jgi:uncharacterized protein (UPF0276 family)